MPPVISGGAPTGMVASGTSVTLAVTTNENAQCRYSTTSQQYAAMTPFATTGASAHSQPLGTLADGNYTIHVRCMDGAGNANTVDYTVGFSVQAPPPISLSIAPWFPQGMSYVFICEAPGATSYDFYFGDGNSNLGRTQGDVYYTYAAPGNYSVICNANGASSSLNIALA
jgi:hypothetical protein